MKVLGRIISLGLIILVMNCTGGKSNYDVTQPVQTIVSGEEKAEQYWSERMDSLKAKKALEAYLALSMEDTLSIDTWAKLSRAYYFFGQFIETEPATKDSLFMLGYEASQSILKRNSEYNNLLFSTGDEKIGVMGLDERYTDVLYWGMANYGRWLETKGPLVRLGQRDLIMTILEHIHDLDSNYYHGAYFRYKGALLTRDPSAGDDTEAVREAFQRAIDLAPDYLGNYTFMAEYYCPLVKDKDLFYQLLTKVITAPVNPNLPYHPENEYEKKLADRMMMRAENEGWF